MASYKFKNIHGWKIQEGLVFLNFYTKTLDQIKKIKHRNINMKIY